MHTTAPPQTLTLQQLSDLLTPGDVGLLPVSRSLLDTFRGLQDMGYEIGLPYHLALTQPRPGHAAWGVPISNPAGGYAGDLMFFVPISNTSRSTK